MDMVEGFLVGNVAVIGENLRNLRKISGLSQQEVAAILGVSYQQVQKYERGDNRFPVEKLFLLKQFYGVSYDVFFAGFANEAMLRAAPDHLSLFERLGALKDQAMRRKAYQIMDVLLEGAV